MKTSCKHSTVHGSVLLIAILTLTILTMICATSLYITAQNTNATSQTASWQVALSGAESGVEQAYYALNKGQWTGWKTVAGSLPTSQPSGGTAASTAPTTGNYVYLARTIQLQGEGGGNVKFWATIDTAGLAKDQNGNQWYRIRSTGVAAAPGPPRVSNQKRDNDLRKVSIRTDRMTGLALVTPQAARTIEVVAAPVTTSIWTRAVTLRNTLTMNGGGLIDSFDSSNPLYSTNHLYDSTKRHAHGDVGIVDSTGSSLNDSYLYGNVAYSGPAIKKTSHVQGTISTPFQTSIPATSDPTWSTGTYTSYSGGGLPFNSITSGTANHPALIKINGDLKVSSGQTLTITAQDSHSDDNAVIVWVSGKFTTNGGSLILQDPNVKVTWYVDDDITVNGNSYPNSGGYASNLNFIGVGNHNLKINGQSDIIATFNDPGYDSVIDGGGGLIGAIIAKMLKITGGGGIHYDAALAANGNNDIGNFSYASWFEDISDVARGQTY